MEMREIRLIQINIQKEINKHAYRQKESEINKIKPEGQTDGESDRRTDIETDGRTDRDTDRRRDRQTDRHTIIPRYKWR